MALLPKRVKYRKAQRGRMCGISLKGSDISFGEFGLKSLENAWMTGIQIEAARVALMRHLKRGGKVWIRVFPDKPVSKKPAETRQGKGKGATDHWVCVIKRGRIIFELAGMPIEIAREALRRASHKLPVRTKFVARRGAGG